MPVIARKALKPRTKPAEVRQDDILRAATALFIAKGVGATTVDEIASRADVAKGTLYLYFTSKEDVVIALRERFVTGFRARIRDAIEACPPDDWTARLKSFVSAGIEAYLVDYQLHDVVFHDHRPDQRRMKSDNPLLGDLSTLLVAGTKAGAWSVDDADLAAIVLFQGLHGAVDDAIERGLREGDDLAQNLSALFLKMLRRP
ncbi:TetR/AcrR family transcriptional regulator [Mesorhizobium sp. B2-3-4]|uniref:TetR/AcrR family transcriptional regulator n=1 Tax=Mesorhizobium sp. B2-3-4 TaxID=2589959 RepID=UPI00112BBD49|nr:TetR/AcrR family transcriptional regulator [Mesorhizobium sp. B2-3-4]TPM26986.1 TetR/AcrR family transcriptional regulator [Mesorhizobium sp. B2-3-4]